MILECFFGFEDAVVENLFTVVQVHCHCDKYERKIFNVKLVVKYCYECNNY